MTFDANNDQKSDSPIVPRSDGCPRLRTDESGFTLIELLTVLLIFGILLAAAIASYLGFRANANDAAAKANVRSALVAVEAYRVDNGSYAGMTVAGLRTIDHGVELDRVATASAASFCIDASVNGRAWNIAGPVAPVAAGACP